MDGAQAVVFNWVFSKGPEFHGITGLHEFAQVTSDGKVVPEGKVRAPFTWILNPVESTRKMCEGKKLEGKNFGCFSTMAVGTKIYEVYVVMEPKTDKELKQSDVIYLGTIDTTSTWITSKFGDEGMYFKHQFWDDELKMISKDRIDSWTKKVTTTEGGFMDTEGPEKYRKYCNHKRRRMHAKH